MTTPQIQARLATLGDPEKAAHLKGFFKTGPGEYGEGDLFRGIRVPVLRKVARAHRALAPDETLLLLQSPYHEDRFVALCILVAAFSRGDADAKRVIYKAYLEHTQWINSWDLVDASAHKIVGPYLEERSRKILLKLARSNNMWERRIAIISTLHFIKLGQFEDTFTIAGMLRSDDEELIHKASGWMLREVGKRDMAAAEIYLLAHQMSRTALRYAIERFPEHKRQAFLQANASISPYSILDLSPPA